MFSMAIVALGSVAPVASVTVPTTSAVVTWAKLALLARSRNAPTTDRILDMEYPVSDL
jgi:hypothetical protein